MRRDLAPDSHRIAAIGGDNEKDPLGLCSFVGVQTQRVVAIPLRGAIGPWMPLQTSWAGFDSPALHKCLVF